MEQIAQKENLIYLTPTEPPLASERRRISSCCLSSPKITETSESQKYVCICRLNHLLVISGPPRSRFQCCHATILKRLRGRLRHLKQFEIINDQNKQIYKLIPNSWDKLLFCKVYRGSKNTSVGVGFAHFDRRHTR